MTNVSLMKGESIAECSPWSILQYFWPALSDSWSEKQFRVFESGRFRQVYCTYGPGNTMTEHRNPLNPFILGPVNMYFFKHEVPDEMPRMAVFHQCLYCLLSEKNLHGQNYIGCMDILTNNSWNIKWTIPYLLYQYAFDNPPEWKRLKFKKIRR